MRARAAVPLLAALVVTGCGSSDRETATTPTARRTTPAATTPAAAPTPAEQRAIAARRRAEAPHFASVAPDADRAAVLAGVRRAVLRDARRRARTGELRGRFSSVDCAVEEQDAPLARREPEAPVLRYSCLAVSYRSTAGAKMVIGRPFAVRVDFARRRWASCLFTPVGGEGTHAASTFAVQPSPACVAPPA